LKIAILSKGPGNYSTKRLMKEAKLRGHDIEVIDYTKCYATIEESKPIISYDGKDLNDFDVIIPRIASSYTRYGSAIVRQFEMRGVFTTTSSIALARSRDKLRSMQLLARAGVGIPNWRRASHYQAGQWHARQWRGSSRDQEGGQISTASLLCYG